jgi:pimeloyl-ACP methyl ester carboxylesterase
MEPVILIHGALGSGSQVAPLHALLSGNRDAHVLELEGHGDTPSHSSRYSIDGFAQNVKEFMAARDIARAVLFGYSMGGYLALYVAAVLPELVASVVTLGTKFAWTPDIAARETSRLDPATIRAKVPKFAEQLERRHAGAGGWEVVLAKTATLMRELGARPTVDSALLARIQQPVRLIVGDRDSVVTIDETLAAVRGMACAEFGVLPNTPHPLEQVRLPFLASILKDFTDPSSRNAR